MKEGNIFQRALNGLREFSKPKETEDSIYPMEVVFKGFKASKRPLQIPPRCTPCGTRLVWKPDKYSFTSRGITVTVPEIGRWKCPKNSNHAGEIHLPDFKRYIALGEKFDKMLKSGHPEKN